MSVTPALKASARSAYRTLYRAASSTFAGDDHVLQAFKSKMRSEALAATSITAPEEYQRQIQLTQDIANVLKRNVVQAVKVDDHDESDTWRIRITAETELGDNETIKQPTPRSSRSLRKSEKEIPLSASDAVNHDRQSSVETTKKPLFYSLLKKAHQQRTLPEVREEDLEENFIRGGGPGGQSINKTENNVQLLHKPTGIRVSCQETRSLSQNRKLARRLLLQKLDQIENPGLSKEEMRAAKQRERERRRRKKAKKKQSMKNSSETPNK